MFCILTPALAVPVIVTLIIGMRKTKARDIGPSAAYAAPKAPWKQRLVSIFWQLDLVGLILLVAGFGLFLVTITIANNGVAGWNDAHSIAMLVLGGVLSIAFFFWERYGAKHPLLPIWLLKECAGKLSSHRMMLISQLVVAPSLLRC